MTDVYRIRSVQIWAQARDDYLSGLSAETVCRRHDLGLSAFRRRARQYGWRRSDQVPPPPGELDLSIYADVGLDDQIDTARLRFVQALEQGKATEARRWRRLWQELVEATAALDADMFPGKSREEVAALIAADEARHDALEDEEALRLAPTLSLKVHHCALEKISPPLSPPSAES